MITGLATLASGFVFLLCCIHSSHFFLKFLIQNQDLIFDHFDTLLSQLDFLYKDSFKLFDIDISNIILFAFIEQGVGNISIEPALSIAIQEPQHSYISRAYSGVRSTGRALALRLRTARVSCPAPTRSETIPNLRCASRLTPAALELPSDRLMLINRRPVNNNKRCNRFNDFMKYCVW